MANGITLAESGRNQDPRILMVCDAPELAESIRPFLEQAGLVLQTAADGPQAVKAAHIESPAAFFVVDRVNCTVDGREVFELLRGDTATASIPIVVATARAAEIDRVAGRGSLTSRYVTNPFSPRELVLAIKGLLGG